jgi:hypothetical protein
MPIKQSLLILKYGHSQNILYYIMQGRQKITKKEKKKKRKEKKRKEKRNSLPSGSKQ